MGTLASITDLTDRATLTAAQEARAPALLTDASSLIRGYTKRAFEFTAGDQVTLRPVGSHLRLPRRPVIAVDQVEMIGTAGSVDRVMGVSEWAWDGIDQIELWPCPTTLSGVTPTATYADTYRITYDHGYSPVPDDVVALCCRMVLDVLLAPTLTAGLVQERIGQYAYQYGQATGAGSPGATVRLTEADKQMLKDAGYRRTAGTVQMTAG
jgi:hypothetical protein